MTSKREVLRAEDEGWSAFHAVVESLSPEKLEAPGYYPEGWSVKDLMAHIASWQAEATRVLTQLRFDTYRKADLDVDAMNQLFYESNKDVPLPLVKAELWSARTRMLTELNALPEVTPLAEEWFVESGAKHYDEHLPRLSEWAEQLRVRSC
jgi:hypothetical protein